MVRISFTETIRLRRESLGLTQKELAEAIGVDTPMYSRIERGARPIKEECITVVASILKLDAQMLRKRWIADKVISVVDNEENAADILTFAAKSLTNDDNAEL